MSDLPGKKKKNMNSGNIESTFLPGNIQLELGRGFTWPASLIYMVLLDI